MTRETTARNLFARHEAVLALVILLEVILFQALGRNFLTGGNVSNIFRHSVEIGLLALVMTPVILSGGPAQVWILVAVSFAVWFLVHRTTFGRSLRAIGYAPEGARYAGQPMGRILVTAYVLAGAAAGLAAVKQAGKTGVVKVVGLGLPSENRAYIKEGVTQAIVLWNPEDLGYLAVHAGAALAKGDLRDGAENFRAGKLNELEVEGDSVILGEPEVFTKKNIDDFDF